MVGRFFICCSTGCPRRKLDTATIYNYLKVNGGQPIRRPEYADLIIVYTCGAFYSTEQRSLATIKSMLRRKRNGATLIVTGCLVRINRSVLRNTSKFTILDPFELRNLDVIIGARIPYETVPDANVVPAIAGLSNGSYLWKFKNNFRFTRDFLKKSLKFILRTVELQNPKAKLPFSDDVYNVKIAHGCLGNCSYCAIRIAAGQLKSKPMDQIFREFKNGLAKGYKRFVLRAEDIGCYGLDIGTTSPKLLRNLFCIPGDFKIQIKDFNARWLVRFFDELLPTFAHNHDKIEVIGIPIQSGSDRILQLMKRHYRIASVKRCLIKLKENIPQCRLYTHMLVGFPGESDSDFRMSKDIVKEIDFAGVSTYVYEDRPGTGAFYMPGKVPETIKFKRKRQLCALCHCD